MSLLFEYGSAPPGEVTAWADSWIVELDVPSDTLIDLATTLPNETVEISSGLRKLSAGADIWMALRSAFPRLRDIAASSPAKAEVIANHLFSTGCKYITSEVPEDLHFIYRFEDAFSLAQGRIFGDLKTIHREFIRELSKF